MSAPNSRAGGTPRDGRNGPYAEFAALMRTPPAREDDLPLDRAAAVIARGVAAPDLDVAAVLAQLDRLAAPLRDRLPTGRGARAGVAVLSDHLARECGFRGNEDDYYDPRNSFLHDVLERRVGIPISLSLVWIEIARRAGFPLAGVGLPGHFLVKHAPAGSAPAPADALYLDPFAGGAIVTPAQLRQRVEATYMGRLPFAEHYLGAVTKKQLLTRMLLNLKLIYQRRNDARRALAVVEHLLLITPWDMENRRDRGFLLLGVGDQAHALDDLEVYERFAPDDAPDLPAIREYIQALRRRFLPRSS